MFVMRSRIYTPNSFGSLAERSQTLTRLCTLCVVVTEPTEKYVDMPSKDLNQYGDWVTGVLGREPFIV